MKVTTQQKILGGVMILGLGLLALDRFRAAATPADEPVSEEPLAVQTIITPNIAPASEIHIFSVADRLEELRADNATVDDAFASIPVVVVTASSDTSKKSPAAPQWRLTSVKSSVHGAEAVINGSIVALGETVNGFRLVAVSNNSVILRGSNKLIKIQMA